MLLKYITHNKKGDGAIMEKVITLENIAGVEAIMPEREENGGNHTKVIFETGTEWAETIRCSTYIKNLAKIVSFDMQAWKFNAGLILSKNYGIPLPMHPGVVLVPVKVRVAEYKDEGSYGYINLMKLEGIEKIDKKTTRLFFTSGLEIDVMSNFNTVDALLVQARCCYDIQFKSFKKCFRKKRKLKFV